MSAQDALDRLNRTTRKLDALADFNYLKAKREIAQWRADDAAEEESRRDRSRRHADACRKIAERYDGAFEKFGQQTPQSVADEYPGDYRRRLLQQLIDKLPESHEWANVEADDLDKEAIKPIEDQVLEAAKREGETPSLENLPKDGSMIKRETRDDSTGRHIVTWHGRESFIKSMGRPGLRVLRICNPNTGQVLFGPPFPQMPGR
jgi:hypothetical protein